MEGMRCRPVKIMLAHRNKQGGGGAKALISHIYIYIYIYGLECNCKSVVIATRGGGLGPHRHDGTSPLPAYTTLAPAFSPNVSRNKKRRA